jgi:hypothetical protein
MHGKDVVFELLLLLLLSSMTLSAMKSLDRGLLLEIDDEHLVRRTACRRDIGNFAIRHAHRRGEESVMSTHATT